jgi:hypothetical protein
MNRTTPSVHKSSISNHQYQFLHERGSAAGHPAGRREVERGIGDLRLMIYEPNTGASVHKSSISNHQYHLFSVTIAA